MKHRNRCGITQTQLAFECEITLRQIQRIEAGATNFGIIYLKRIAAALEVKTKELLES